jgi:hypothetical protein
LISVSEQRFAVLACWAGKIHVVRSVRVHSGGSVAVAGEGERWRGGSVLLVVWRIGTDVSKTMRGKTTRLASSVNASRKPSLYSQVNRTYAEEKMSLHEFLFFQ